MPTHVKLFVDGESFWAVPCPERGPDVYRIDNILLLNDHNYCFGDIVRADSNHRVLECIETTYWQWTFNYPVPKIEGTDSVDNDQIEKNWKKWRTLLKDIDVHIEGIVFGTCTVAYPKAWTLSDAIHRIHQIVPEFAPSSNEGTITTMTETEQQIKNYLERRIEECSGIKSEPGLSEREHYLWGAREEALRGVYDTFFKERT